MNNMRKEVEKRICELLKGTELDPMLHMQYEVTPIREAEVLDALEFHDWKLGLMISSSGVICNMHECFAEWQLGKTLQEQSDETIQFLYLVLCK